MTEPVCQKPGCGSRRVIQRGDFWWCRDHGPHSVGCRCDKCVTYTEPANAESSLWVNPQYPPPAMRVLPVEQWDFFALAGHLLKSCQAKYSVEQQRKVGEFAKTLVAIAESQRVGTLRGAPEPARNEASRETTKNI